MSDLIDFLEENYPKRGFLFTMDNLNIHKHPIILNLIEDSGHRIVFRAPYWSCDGSIEYAFNTIHTILEMSGDKMENVNALVNRIIGLTYCYCYSSPVLTLPNNTSALFLVHR